MDPQEIFNEGVSIEAQEHRSRRLGQLAVLERECQSPIELALGAALMFVDVPIFDQDFNWMRPKVVAPGDWDSLAKHRGLDRTPPLEFVSRVTWPHPGVFIVPQFQLLRYRVDFLLVARTEALPLGTGFKDWHFIIECDGHDYHERTKAQARRDRERDRQFMHAGFTVYRFTGSEIYRGAQRCAREVQATLIERLEEYEGVPAECRTSAQPEAETA